MLPEPVIETLPNGSQPQLETSPGLVPAGPGQVPGFQVNLPQFEGPFDLLLTLIARKRLDITELALAEVTDEFIAHMRADWDLGRASEFLVVASTLLALKAHRLLPHDPEEMDEDMELLEARDVLFARLLQYRAFKEAAKVIRSHAEAASRTHPRVVSLPPELAALLPRLVATSDAEDLARIAADVLTRRRDPGVQTVHLHERVPVGEQLRLLASRLRRAGTLTFTELTADAGRTAVVVARFLALLILYRQGGVDLAQESPMGEITVSWRDESLEDPSAVAADSLELEEEFA
ncbi:ScpA family protein [Actinomyces sp. 565]|uniref:segregation and condensation protein A n=1 Tax=Actinomyces sp. 565 TaxID=2057794 RepID=UPI0013A707EB|nr:ScpA family protein [Actinomyces sp. 565]NDR52628.1 segregation/condensation protein A [Actinomyces sp. 565]